MAARRQKTLLVTPSYAPDLDRCATLIESVHRYCSGFERHVVIVPAKDIASFKPYVLPNVELITAESLLPNHLVQTPVSKFWWDRISFTFRRGWLVQQLIKLTVVSELRADACVFVDSDTCFIRPLDARSLWRDDKIRLYKSPRAPHFYVNPRYLNWYGAASTLVAKPEERLSYAYISQLTSMRREIVDAMTKRISENFGRRDWQRALLDAGDVSEFILYGCFCESAPFIDGHWYTDEQLCLSSWFYDISSIDDVTQFIADVTDTHVAIHIQSNLNIPAQRYQQAINAIRQ